MRFKDRALDVIATICHFTEDGTFDQKQLKELIDDIYLISHSFLCSKNCRKNARKLTAKWIREFRKIRYNYYWHVK